MSAISWKSGVSGTWNDGTKWSGGLAPTSSDDATISVAGVYTVSFTGSAVAASLTFNAASAILSEGTLGSLGIVGAFDLEAGMVILRAANSIGSVTETGGSLQLYDGGALGSANLTLDGGELAGMATETVANHLDLGGAGFTIDAATGTALTVGGGAWSLHTASTPTIQFGSAARNGTVVWRTPSGTIGGGGGYLVDVAAGTLEAGDKSLGFLLRHDKSTTVAAGATIDLNGFSATINALQGDGAVVNGGATAALILNAANFFAGDISGPIGVEIATTSNFTGVNTYTGGTTIDSGQALGLFGDGSVAGAIVDNGALDVGTNGGTFTPGLISGTGVVSVNTGDGNLVLSAANTYSGGTYLYSGNILLGNGAGLGTGVLTLGGGELVGTATETVTNDVTFGGGIVYGATTTVAAATGKTLTFSGGAMTWDASGTPSLTVTFGDGSHAGTVMIGSSGSVVSGGPIHVKVAYGVLEANPNFPDHFLDFATDVRLSAGAAIDLNGDEIVIPGLSAAGSIINSASTLASILTEDTSSVTSPIAGRIFVGVANGTLTLSGANTYTGGTLIESGATLNLGTGSAAGSIVGDVNDQGVLVIRESGAVKLAGVISGSGSLTQSGSGTTTLSGVNTYSGGTTLLQGKLTVTNGKALGSGSVTLDTGTELLSTATMALAATQNSSNTFSFNGTTTIAAAHGTTLTIGGAPVQVNAGVMIFGQGANDGTILFKVGSGAAPGPFSIKVNAGTLEAGDSTFGALAETANSLTVATGAALDFAGFSGGFQSLAGAGSVTNSSATLATVTDGAGSFGGVISGKIKLEVDGAVTLTGANTYTGTTDIISGAVLQLGTGGATGSIVGAIDDEGALVVDESGTVAFAGEITGAGSVTQKGTGITNIAVGNTYAGGTTIQRGELISGRSAALGTGGTITLTGGELLASATQILTHDLTTTGTVTFAAAASDTLTLAAANATFNAGKIYFGEGANSGTVVLKASSSLSTPDPTHTTVEVRTGVLKAGDDGLSVLLDGVAGTRIDSGATIDAGGQFLEIDALTGAGLLTNTGAANLLDVFGATVFSGVLAGKWTEVELFNTATLSGDETFTGKAVIEGGTVTLSGLFAEATQFNGGGTLILTTPSRFTGQIQSFASGDTIDLRNITTGSGAVLTYNAGTGVLTVKDGTHTDHLTFSGSYVLGNFAAASDGSGGTDISWQTPPPMAARPAPLVSAMAGFAAPAAAPASPSQVPALAHPLLAAAP